MGPSSRQPATEALRDPGVGHTHMLMGSHILTAHTCSHVDSLTHALTQIPQMCPPHLTHVLMYIRCSHTYTLTHLPVYLHTCSNMYTHICSHVPIPTHTCSHVHACTLSHTAHAGLQFLSDTPVTPLPDGDHVPTVTLDVPAAVGARRVVEGPGWAVDDSTPFCVLLQFPTTGSYWERRLRSSGLSFGWKVGWGDT